MAKPGIKILSEEVGSGPALQKGDRVRIHLDTQLNRGEFLVQDEWVELVMGDRNAAVAGLLYGLEGMRAGGKRRFKASAHLCYRDVERERIPKNAALIFDVKSVKVVRCGGWEGRHWFSSD